MEVEEPEVEWEDGNAKKRDVMLGTFERQTQVKRRADEEDMAVDVLGNLSYSAFDNSDCDGIDPALIQAAKEDDMRVFAERQVYKVVDRSKHKDKPSSIMLSCKWVLRNKGTDRQPEIKARFVAREFVSDKIDRDTLFAPTPCLPAVRAVIYAVASGQVRHDPLRLLIMDIRAAFLYGHCSRRLYIELPECDPSFGNPSLIGRLERPLYGCRDAPQPWAKELERVLKEEGFEQSFTMPAVFVQRSKGTQLVTHVDDLLAGGSAENLNWLIQRITARFENRSSIIGPEAG